MKKRTFLFLTFAAVIGSGLSGQSNFISGEQGIDYGVERGFAYSAASRYERVLTRYVTLGGYMYVNFGTTISSLSNGLGLDIGIAAFGRWYPFGRKFFTELGLAGIFYMDSYDEYKVSTSSSSTSYATEKVRKTDTYGGFGIIPGLGWTIDVGKPGRIFLSPGLKVPIGITSEKGIRVSVVVSFGFGWAF